LSEHYLPLLNSLGIITADEDSPYLGPVLAEMGRLEQSGQDVKETIHTLLATRETTTAENVLAILHHRLEKHLKSSTGDVPRIAGLIQAPPTITNEDTLHAIEDRILAIQLRAEEVLDTAIEENQPWMSELGEILPGEEETWRARGVTIACYRDLYNITSDSAIRNSFTSSKNKQHDRDIAAQALNFTQRTPINSSQEPASSTLDQLQTFQVGHGERA
jgi:hypothetical protein